MGYEATELRVYATLNRHNTWKDTRDNALWMLFRARVMELAADPVFADIQPTIQ